MIQSINLDDDLIAQATQLSDAGDLNGVIEMALREYIDRRQRLKIVDLFGTIDSARRRVAWIICCNAISGAAYGDGDCAVV